MELAAWLLATPLCVLLGYLTLELLLGLLPLKASTLVKGTPPPSSMILVPAYNEAANIAQTVEALRKVAPAASILVVADNCTDDTARLARAAGAQTAERFDLEHRGKGYALDFGRSQMLKDAPDVVIVVDADCQLVPGSIERLTNKAMQSGAPVQARYIMISDDDSSPLVSISNFAFLIKNLVRARGLSRLSGTTTLYGTGMAFPWKIFAALPLATGNAVEDLELGLWLARKKIAIQLDDSSLVTSRAASLAASLDQRSRWEHGFLQTALQKALPLLRDSIKSGSLPMTALSFHLMIPPLALLIVIALLSLSIIGLLTAISGSWPAFVLSLIAFSFLSLAILLAWWREGRAALPFRTLLLIPFYVLWKIPIYLRFFTNRQRGWNRTRREGESDDGSSATR